MADRPIIFSRPMIHALLAGRKTQTRRVLKNVPPQPEVECHPAWEQKHPAPYLDAYNKTENWCWWQVDDRCCQPLFSVRYAVGDRLWVRETWAHYRLKGEHMWGNTIYKATFSATTAPMCEGFTKWQSPRYMRRADSRLTLTVTQVRVQRLQDISEADAMAEGVPFTALPQGRTPDPLHVGQFADLWNSIHGDDAWAENLWVAAISFTVARKNIDEEPA